MRRGFDTLALAVQQVLGEDPRSGALFVFAHPIASPSTPTVPVPLAAPRPPPADQPVSAQIHTRPSAASASAHDPTFWSSRCARGSYPWRQTSRVCPSRRKEVPPDLNIPSASLRSDPSRPDHRVASLDPSGVGRCG